MVAAMGRRKLQASGFCEYVKGESMSPATAVVLTVNLLLAYYLGVAAACYTGERMQANGWPANAANSIAGLLWLVSPLTLCGFVAFFAASLAFRFAAGIAEARQHIAARRRLAAERILEEARNMACEVEA